MMRYSYISPISIRTGVEIEKGLLKDMKENTEKFICNEVSPNNSFVLKLIFRGSLSELPENLSEFPEFVMNNKEKIIALYKYVTGSNRRWKFYGYPYEETDVEYNYIYVDFATIINVFELNGYTCEITEPIKSSQSIYNDALETRFVVSKKLVEEEGPKRVRKI